MLPRGASEKVGGYQPIHPSTDSSRTNCLFAPSTPPSILEGSALIFLIFRVQNPMAGISHTLDIQTGTNQCDSQ
jgi:hypothetical protein